MQKAFTNLLYLPVEGWLPYGSIMDHGLQALDYCSG